MPVQVWATWFPREGKPQSFLQGFPWDGLHLSAKGQSAFHFKVANNGIGEDSCRGALQVEGHSISWDLRYRSTFRIALSAKGWIGFSRTPHSDAAFSGRVTLDDRNFEGSPLGFGVQGHNCGYRHRDFWTWTHAYFLRPNAPAEHARSLGLRNAIRSGVSQSRALIPRSSVRAVIRGVDSGRIKRGTRTPRSLR
jgi:hypothetical protein